MTYATEEAVREHNRLGLWSDIADRIGAASHELQLVLGLFDDLEQYGSVQHISANLAPVAESVERFRVLAAEKAGR